MKPFNDGHFLAFNFDRMDNPTSNKNISRVPVIIDFQAFITFLTV
jgi:hypothetical protein